jgi:enoyl-CoA hydratase/carnithine racemase
MKRQEVPMTANYTNITRHGSVLVVEIDNPPVNALSPGVPEAIGAALDEADGDDDVVAVVFRGAGRMFVAGADITKLQEAAWGNASAVPNWHDLSFPVAKGRSACRASQASPRRSKCV